MSNGSAPSFAFTSLTEPSGSVIPSKIPSGFNSTTALILANACALTYAQLTQGSEITSDQLSRLNNGAGTSYDFKLLATFTVSEPLGLGFTSSQPGIFVSVPIGFVVQSPSNFSILALRGTQTYAEWVNDVDIIPTTYELGSLFAGNVHGGFFLQYTLGTDGTAQSNGNRPAGSLASQVAALFASNGPLNNSGLPLYVTGHSLGAALAVFAALDVAANFASNVRSSVSMYHFAPPQVSASGLFGSDTVFAHKFQTTVTDSYAIVNAADIVPILPPPSLSLGSYSLQYEPAVSKANTIFYCAQLGDIDLNHSLADNYLPYTTQLLQGFSS